MSQTLKRVGQRTVQFSNPPCIISTATIVGPKEGEGPLAHTFDKVMEDTYYGQKSWEKAESKILEESVQMALQKVNLSLQDIDYLLAGDLINQIICCNFAARTLGIPFFGLYGACSTMYEGLALGAMLIDGGFASKVVAATCSHHNTSERQYRYPTELGSQRPMTAQWTITGAGAFVLASEGTGPRITHATVGKVVDAGVKDPFDMGAAMAPAALDTLVNHFKDTGRGPQDYDLIVTGDLASVGRSVLIQLAQQQGYDLSQNYTDCGVLIFDPSQDTHAGGSGCACIAVVTGGYILNQMKAGKLRRILGIATGALLSPLSVQQGESIPGIAHAVAIEL
ncbi:stage V sporulation protein AD [Calderihabitans maritimus]|uniref:Stage V sporulation protein AD n=1 Tax=Calderihabitans maritimus TaxID=1246530 RepID=A0A1Z5HPB5_9FIRM|nr:stage V sporulation protein AD [Calderihabitans maritimus]GAW91354.1 stage V sporulation protein AD [Calderihabitans maritimus]